MIKDYEDEWPSEDGEAAEDDKFIPQTSVRLPVGLPKDGVRYRDVEIDEMTGIDDHLISSKKVGNNGAKGLTLVICRCTQSVEGFHPFTSKTSTDKQFDRSLGRNMTQPDRDFLISRIFMLSGRNDTVMAGKCSCGVIHQEEVRYSELPVVEWPDDAPLYIEFELEKGVPDKTGTFHKIGKVRFPRGSDQERAGGMTDPAAITDAMFAACIIELGDLEGVDQEMVKRMTRSDREILWTALRDKLPGVKQWKIIQCECGLDVEVKVDQNSFFTARRSKGKKSSTS